MKKFFLLTLLLLVGVVQAQETTTGAIGGKLTDKEMGGEPLPFANVLLKDSSKGTTSDYDGIYLLDKLQPGTYRVVFSFVGYETLEIPDVVVEAGKVTEINTELGSSAASLDEVVITTVSRRDSEVALLVEQKNSVEIKESIGAVELAKLGVSDAATATTKISGVTTSEASGDLFVRGLGDRYLYSTMNGLPIPSDDVERKNIDLGLFPTRVIQNVSISKAYSAISSADQASGNVDISSRELRGKDEAGFSVQAGINTNAAGVFNDFKVSPNQEDNYFGVYDQSIPTEFTLNNQSWNPQTSVPVNRKVSITAGKEFGPLRAFVTASNSVAFEYNEGLFRNYRTNVLEDQFTDAENFKKTDNNTLMADLGFEINDNHRLKATSLFINKVTDEVYEAGRNGEGFVFEETNRGENLNQFIRDQNIKQTRLWVNQLHGFHDFLDGKNELEWSAGYNLVNADEPNRIRNEVNIGDNNFVQLARTGGFQQRKSTQEIDDTEFNARIENTYNFLSMDNEDSKNSSLIIGGNYRNKERDFFSQFFGAEETDFNTVNPSSIDNLGAIFTTENFNNRLLQFNRLTPDIYNGTLESYGGFAVFNIGNEQWNINAGARYQKDQVDVIFDVNNYPQNLPNFTFKEYDNVYPSLNIKFSPNEDSNIRLAASKTISLPEFKEIAPFEYVSQIGQITRGNPNLEASNNYNLDLKYEVFPSSGELLSLTGFYKKILDPINRTQARGASGVFSYFNASDEANIYGLELEARMDVIENDNDQGLDMSISGNITRMWHSQDLKDVFAEDGSFVRTFRYNGNDEIGLQGASDWIVNASANFSTETENPFRGTIVANYASDKIYALGSPDTQNLDFIDIQYNDEIIEKGFVTLDLILTKEFGNNFELEFKGQNLLNPEIERYQAIRPLSGNAAETEQTVRSYTRGAILSLGLSYNF